MHRAMGASEEQAASFITAAEQVVDPYRRRDDESVSDLYGVERQWRPPLPVEPMPGHGVPRKRGTRLRERAGIDA